MNVEKDHRNSRKNWGQYGRSRLDNISLVVRDTEADESTTKDTKHTKASRGI